MFRSIKKKGKRRHGVGVYNVYTYCKEIKKKRIKLCYHVTSREDSDLITREEGGCINSKIKYLPNICNFSSFIAWESWDHMRK